MTVKFQHQHWNTTSKSTEDSDDFHLQLGFRQTSLGLTHRRKLKALKKYSDKEIYVKIWKKKTWNILERQQNTNDDDDKL